MTETVKESTGMNPKIKERIEQICQGIVPEGYKKTKIGIFPVDWKVKKLADINNVNTGLTPTRKNEKYFNGDIPWVKTTDLNNSFIHTTEEKITKTALEETSIKLVKKNSVLIAMYGGFNQIGRTGLLKVDATTNQAISSIKVNEGEFHSVFVLYWLNFFRAMWRRYAASSRKDPNITKKDVEDFTIIKPKYNEQQQIANVLSTWDRAIELKEALIKEKEEQKKGKLEYFFSKDFNESYTEEKFDNVFYRIPNGKYRINKKDYLEKGEFPVVDQSKSYIAGYTNQKEKLFEINNNPVIIFGDHTRVFKFVDFDFVVGADGTNILSTKKEYDIKYFYYAISSKRIPDTGYNRHYKFLQEMTFYVPPIKLQKKVSKILSYLDYNINLLKQELSLLKEQKKGLMQLLLTGIVRVGEVEDLE